MQTCAIAVGNLPLVVDSRLEPPKTCQDLEV